MCSCSNRSSETHDRPVLRAPCHFHCALGFATRVLAHMLDSLVRVSRRAAWTHFVLRARPRRADGSYEAGAFILLSWAFRLRQAERTGRATLGPCTSPSAISGAFDRLFKRLFIFPSQYLFAIGLLSVFSFRWDLPPNLACIPKHADSSDRSVCDLSLPAGRGSHPLRLRTLSAIPRARSLELTFRLQVQRILNLSSSRFTRRYWGNPC